MRITILKIQNFAPLQDPHNIRLIQFIREPQRLMSRVVHD